MAPPKGNRFWELRSKSGRNEIFASPKALWGEATKYFAWVEDNPLWEHKVTQYQGDVIEMKIPKLRAMTIGGLCLYLGISTETWCQYRKKDNFSDICGQVDEVIRLQKFTGAAADQLNPSIIARDLGLADKTEITTQTTKPAKDMSPEEAARSYEDMMNGGK